ncbi:MAG: hypothetical protein SFW67_28620 [Myxococcaceae bacterium]|nr:hypothetical protein [Myxococcaceae bacterium]
MAGRNADVIEDWLRPDGSVDWDRVMTVDPAVDWTQAGAARKRRDQMLRHYEATKRDRAVPRVEQALRGAPVAKGIPGLAEGSSATPFAPIEKDAVDSALQRLASLNLEDDVGTGYTSSPAPAAPQSDGWRPGKPWVPSDWAKKLTPQPMADETPESQRELFVPVEWSVDANPDTTERDFSTQGGKIEGKRTLPPLVAKRLGRGPKKLETGASMSPAPERPKFDPLPTEAPEGGAPSARTPLKATEAMVAGAAPPVDTSADEKELDDARKRRDMNSFLAQMATQFGNYADIQSGTQTGDRGAALRQQAGRPVEDVNAKRALRQQAADRQQEGIDRDLNRQSLTESLAMKRQSAKEKADYQDGTSSVSARRRALATSMYPAIVAKIPPEQFREMSAADIDTLLGEAAPQKGAGGGGLGLSGAQMNSLRNKLPQHIVDSYNSIGRVKQMVQDIGGWGKTKTGIAGGMLPAVFMDNNTRALRQELGGVVARFLQAGGGKSITKNEERVLIGRIAADPTSANLRPEDLERGLAIIERSLAGDLRQSLAGAPEAAKGALLGDMGIPREWMGQDLQAPLSSKQPAPKKPRLFRNPKTGETVEVE